MLPAVKSGIDRPFAGPDQRERQGKHRQCGGDSRVGRRCEGDPQLGAGRYNTGGGRPKTGHEEETGQRSNDFRRHHCATVCGYHAIQKSSADQ